MSFKLTKRGFKKMMRIDRKVTNIPLALAKGTMAERFEKATNSNINFIKKLGYDFEYEGGKITLGTIKRTLKSSKEMKNIVTKVVPVERDSEAFLGHSHTANGTNRGYIMGLPLQLSKNTINQEKTPLIAKQAQKLFIDAYNPKFIQRQANMFNKKQDFAGTKEFFDGNLSGKTTLNPENLDKFLGKKSADERINILQMLRYSTISEKELKKAEPEIDRQIAKRNNLRIQKNYDLSAYSFDEKLEVLNKRLASELQAERLKHAQSLNK